MKRPALALLTVVAAAVAAPSVLAADDDYVRLASNLCDYTKANDRSLMRKKLKEADLQLRRVYGGILCAKDDKFSGGTLLRTAVAHGATDAADFILSQVGGAATKNPEHDGKTIVQWTEEQAASDPGKKAFLDMFAAAGS